MRRLSRILLILLKNILIHRILQVRVIVPFIEFIVTGRDTNFEQIYLGLLSHSFIHLPSLHWEWCSNRDNRTFLIILTIFTLLILSVFAIFILKLLWTPELVDPRLCLQLVQKKLSLALFSTFPIRSPDPVVSASFYQVLDLHLEGAAETVEKV